MSKLPGMVVVAGIAGMMYKILNKSTQTTIRSDMLFFDGVSTQEIVFIYSGGNTTTYEIGSTLEDVYPEFKAAHYAGRKERIPENALECIHHNNRPVVIFVHDKKSSIPPKDVRAMLDAKLLEYYAKGELLGMCVLFPSVMIRGTGSSTEFDLAVIRVSDADAGAFDGVEMSFEFEEYFEYKANEKFGNAVGNIFKRHRLIGNFEMCGICCIGTEDKNSSVLTAYSPPTGPFVRYMPLNVFSQIPDSGYDLMQQNVFGSFLKLMLLNDAISLSINFSDDTITASGDNVMECYSQMICGVANMVIIDKNGALHTMVDGLFDGLIQIGVNADGVHTFAIPACVTTHAFIGSILNHFQSVKSFGDRWISLTKVCICEKIAIGFAESKNPQFTAMCLWVIYLLANFEYEKSEKRKQKENSLKNAESTLQDMLKASQDFSIETIDSDIERINGKLELLNTSLNVAHDNTTRLHALVVKKLDALFDASDEVASDEVASDEVASDEVASDDDFLSDEIATSKGCEEQIQAQINQTEGIRDQLYILLAKLKDIKKQKDALDGSTEDFDKIDEAINAINNDIGCELTEIHAGELISMMERIQPAIGPLLKLFHEQNDLTTKSKPKKGKKSDSDQLEFKTVDRDGNECLVMLERYPWNV